MIANNIQNLTKSKVTPPSKNITFSMFSSVRIPPVIHVNLTFAPRKPIIELMYPQH